VKDLKENYDFLRFITIGFGIASLGIALAVLGFILSQK